MVRMSVSSDDDDGAVSTMTLGPEDRVTTDEKGYFLISGLPAGKVSLAVDHQEFINTKVEDVEVVRAETREIDKVTLERGGTLHGTVYDETGAPFQRGSLLLFSIDEEGDRGRPKFLTLRPDGGYSQGGLTSGTYQLKVQRWNTDGGAMHLSFGEGEPDAEVRLKVDEERRVNIHLKQ